MVRTPVVRLKNFASFLLWVLLYGMWYWNIVQAFHHNSTCGLFVGRDGCVSSVCPKSCIPWLNSCVGPQKLLVGVLMGFVHL